MIDSARITDADGTVAVTVDGTEWHGLTPESRFWDRYQAWLDLGNSPTPFVPPTPPTDDELVDQWITQSRRVFIAFLDVLAERFGVTRQQIINAIKAKM